ncbi:MAG: Uma2 family endonuclease [Bryobacterales bacterium]|jgi:Uma2 family endonuclease|nr:Uma2 family endonuclease [Bryobacterales bacterium]
MTKTYAAFPPVCPDFVTEVMSPGDTLGALRKKCHRWMREGARAALRVDSEKGHAALFPPDGEHRHPVPAMAEIPRLGGLTLNLNAAWDEVLQ